VPHSLTCSVIVPTYNRAKLLKYTLDSLTHQSVADNQFEVLVVDDGSSDSTADVVDSYRNRLNIRYFFQEDQGFRVAAARNIGISNASGDICIFIDSGVLLHSTCIQAHISSHTALASPAAVCGYVYCFSQHDTDSARISGIVSLDNPDITIKALRQSGLWPDIREEFYAKNTDDFNHLPAPWFMYWTCNASARTEQVQAVGMFDEAFRCWGGEDIDLGYRLHRDGAHFLVNREASALHYPHEKVYEQLAASALTNYRYIADKYDTPITRLLDIVPTVRFLTVNDLIVERKIPTCADYLAERPGNASI
jgi:glycosyltransferase involved in cell wall biosynthesis